VPVELQGCGINCNVRIGRCHEQGKRKAVFVRKGYVYVNLSSKWKCVVSLVYRPFDFPGEPEWNAAGVICFSWLFNLLAPELFFSILAHLYIKCE